MAICNIFKEISKSTGTFLTFSQYAEDVTKQHSTGNNYRVVPSKFYTCNINYSKLDNQTLPILLQNKFENGCAFLKDTMGDDWTPEYAHNLFWNSIRDLIIGDELLEDGIPTGKFPSTINYIGDINIESYSSKDNIGYNEIYCYIPNDAKECSVKFAKSANENEFVKCDHEYIMGYDKDDTSISGVIGLNLLDYRGLLDKNEQNEIGYYKKLFYTEIEKTDIDSNLFQFNTIIVSYNVVDNNGNKLYGGIDIPLGIYFTGTIDDVGVMTNPVTKFVSNDDIYGAGTSYGLRICSRFTVTPNSTTIKSDVNLLEGTDAIYTAFSQAMGQMAESQIKMDEMLAVTNEYNMGLKNHIMSISSNKVNVPYIKEVNGVKYWFCNGKNLNVPCQGIQGVTGASQNLELENILDNANVNAVESITLDGDILKVKYGSYASKQELQDSTTELINMVNQINTNSAMSYQCVENGEITGNILVRSLPGASGTSYKFVCNDSGFSPYLASSLLVLKANACNEDQLPVSLFTKINKDDIIAIIDWNEVLDIDKALENKSVIKPVDGPVIEPVVEKTPVDVYVMFANSSTINDLIYPELDSEPVNSTYTHNGTWNLKNIYLAPVTSQSDIADMDFYATKSDIADVQTGFSSKCNTLNGKIDITKAALQKNINSLDQKVESYWEDFGEYVESTDDRITKLDEDLRIEIENSKNSLTVDGSISYVIESDDLIKIHSSVILKNLPAGAYQFVSNENSGFNEEGFKKSTLIAIPSSHNVTDDISLSILKHWCDDGIILGCCGWNSLMKINESFNLMLVFCEKSIVEQYISGSKYEDTYYPRSKVNWNINNIYINPVNVETGPQGATGPIGLQGITGSMFINTGADVNIPDNDFSTAANAIIESFNFRIGDYTVSNEGNIWTCNSTSSFIKGVNIRGKDGYSGSTGTRWIVGEKITNDDIEKLAPDIISELKIRPDDSCVTLEGNVWVCKGTDSFVDSRICLKGERGEKGSQIKYKYTENGTDLFRDADFENSSIIGDYNFVTDDYAFSEEGNLWICDGTSFIQGPNFIGPQGQQGITGSRGVTGVQGTTGPRGVTGATGVCTFYGGKIDVTFTATNEQISVHVRKNQYGTEYENASIIEVQGLGGNNSANNKLNIYGLKNDEIIFLIYKRNESLGQFSLYDGDHGGAMPTPFWTADSLSNTKDGLLFMIGKHNDKYRVLSITKMENYGIHYDY